MKILKLPMIAVGAIMLSLTTSKQSEALMITADTTGNDNFSDSSFYGVSFENGSGFISSISYDLSLDANAFFDFDGTASLNDSTNPVLDLSSLVGLSAADISFSFIPPQPTVLTVNFAAGSFGAGDSFRFGADTDFLVSDPASGSVFGDAGVVFSATLENGNSLTTSFSRASSTRSLATISIEEPGATVIDAGSYDTQV